MKKTHAEINLDNLCFNLSEIKKRSGGKELICIVKADAYGHGDKVIAPELQKLGIKFFATASIDEALSLRRAGVKGEILILGWTDPDRISELYENNITQAVFSPEYAAALSSMAFLNEIKVKVHLVIDSGMGRIGFRSSEEVLENLEYFKNFETEGVFTHFSSADMFDDESVNYTDNQASRFKEIVSELKSFNFKYIHSFNSAALITRKDDFTNLARVGIIIYGLMPSDYEYNIPLKPVMSFKSVISMVKTVKEGDSLSYGRQYKASKETRVATVAAGYADGYDRLNGNKTKVVIKGKRCPVIGRVCMDQFMVDVSEVPDVKMGDEVTLFGEGVSCDEVASIAGTVNYDIVCAVSRRADRVYIKDNKIIKILKTDWIETEE